MFFQIAIMYGKYFKEVLQVHNRIEYLKELISTLRDAQYIETTLLIFSHDYSSAAINKLIKGIDFCLVCYLLQKSTGIIATKRKQVQIFC